MKDSEVREGMQVEFIDSGLHAEGIVVGKNRDVWSVRIEKYYNHFAPGRWEDSSNVENIPGEKYWNVFASSMKLLNKLSEQMSEQKKDEELQIGSIVVVDYPGKIIEGKIIKVSNNNAAGILLEILNNEDDSDEETAFGWLGDEDDLDVYKRYWWVSPRSLTIKEKASFQGEGELKFSNKTRLSIRDEIISRIKFE